MTKPKEYDFEREQVFFCLRDDGYFLRFKPKNNPEKQYMYNSYPFVIQVGFNCRDNVRVYLSDGSNRNINPNTIRIGAKPKFLTRKGIVTISLEPRIKGVDENG